jgi:hypothetical protein
MSTVYIGHAVGDEHGQASGGEAGNQNGKELRTQPWYLNKKGWIVLRPKDPKVATKLVYDVKAACNNMNIGYDQKERNTLFREAEKVEFDCAKVTTPCECDCSALVRVCLWYAGVKVGHFNTATEVETLMKTGKFEKLTEDKYTEQSSYLKAGDILVTKVKGHTAIVLNDGSKADNTVDPEPIPSPSGCIFTRLLKYGCKGEDVVELKKLLIDHGYTKGITIDTPASKNFGSSTKNLVKQYQKDNGLVVDGIAGKNTIISLGGIYVN